jgi:hypothetical protein
MPELREGRATIGKVAPAEVDVVFMPRERFMQVVRDTFDDVQSSNGETPSEEAMNQLEAVVIPVAEEMEVFPFGAWVNGQRGCGCIVGEALVARGIIDRRLWVESFNGPYPAQGMRYCETFDIHSELMQEYGTELGSMLYSYGSEVDVNLRHATEQVDEDGDPVNRAAAIVVVD